MSRNSEYEQRRKNKGQKKITLWVPVDSEVELKSMADFLCENNGYVPTMVRSLSTGRLKKAV
ncbi:hypothetical protein CJF42_25345 [Pseudoalteromonas sp. NBT06-2]|uniref:hypothetical protein n=1 Tax=Pseudoalteromonas sp. NBT06-2 TaxID=2025950 RepID=UPI000BA64EE0|nr:hypothetical protein [Pseudoalteromonas sp. NBT06-2]PAJ71691.1 hypothetical protein CJF42_25345 [Pseudoalteromonas sp. NBT06-2]